MFVKKNGLFRPAGGEITFQVSDRVTPVIEFITVVDTFG